MIMFLGTLFGLIILTVLVQVITKMKIVGGNELGIVSGSGHKGFRSLSGGRAFVIPLFNKFAKIDLTPYTIEVGVESAIAAGIVPLNVKATVSFAIASNESGRSRSVTRVLELAHDWPRLRNVASDIIEGHLRDSIASITPEQVMKDKDTLVAKMINACKNDLENIGLEITTMNIADVDDHRLEGVDEPDLYIALLKRVQSASAETRAREAQANARAAATEQEEARRAEIEVRKLENELENLMAETRVRVIEEHQHKNVGVEEAERNATAKVEGLKKQIQAETELIGMLRKKYEAEVITPAQAEKERMVLSSRSVASQIKGRAQGEIDQLAETLAIIGSEDGPGRDIYLLENFERLIGPFAETLQFFPVEKLSVITGTEGRREPISAIHPHAIDMEKNKMLTGALSYALGHGTASTADFNDRNGETPTMGSSTDGVTSEQQQDANP